MTTRWGCHPVVILFWNVNRMGMPSGSYFFSYMNWIGSVVELKIYISLQEEDIKVQEEFVPKSSTRFQVLHGF